MNHHHPAATPAAAPTRTIVQDTATGLYVRQHWRTNELLGWTDEANCARVYESEASARTLLALGGITGVGTLQFVLLTEDKDEGAAMSRIVESYTEYSGSKNPITSDRRT